MLCFTGAAAGSTWSRDGRSITSSTKNRAEAAAAPSQSVCEDSAKCRPLMTYSLPSKMPAPTPENNAAITKDAGMMQGDHQAKDHHTGTGDAHARKRISITSAGCVKLAIARIALR